MSSIVMPSFRGSESPGCSESLAVVMRCPIGVPTVPNPISRVKPNASVFIGGGDCSPSIQRPALALLAMRVLSDWSLLESHMASLFVKMIGTNPRPAAAMYAELSGAAAQKAAFKGLASAVLSRQEYDVFLAILDLFTSAAKERGKIAHWTWGYSPALPDAVLLGDPRALSELHVQLSEVTGTRLAEWPQAGGQRAPEHQRLEPPRDKIYVWTERDFQDVIDRIQHLMQIIHQFSFVLIRYHMVNEDGRQFSALLADPLVGQALRRRSQRQKTALEEPL